MDSASMVRKIDPVGRLVILVELRKYLGLELNDPLEILIDDDKILLKKYAPTCVFCGEAADLTEFRGKRVCPECRKELGIEPAPIDDQMYFYLMGRIDSLIKQLRSMKKQNQQADPIPLLREITRRGEALYRALKEDGRA